MSGLRALFEPRAHRRVAKLVGDAPVGVPLCVQVSAALATDTPLSSIGQMVPMEPLTPKEAVALLRRCGASIRLIEGAAFALFHKTHVARYGGRAFRAVALDIKADAYTRLGHAVYLEDGYLFDPATAAWRRTTDGDRARFDYLAVLEPAAA